MAVPSAGAGAGREALLAALVYVSEGRATATLERIRQAACAHAPAAKLLRHFCDEPYNRSGFTVAGPARPLGEAVRAITQLALRSVDLSLHSGTHPRLGVVDHISVHPLHGASLADASEFAVSVGRQLAAAEQIPVFLYGAASSEGATLDSIRRFLGYFKSDSQGKWQGAMAFTDCTSAETSSLALAPDFGPTKGPFSKGVLTMGAVPWIVNYNVPVTGSDIQTGKIVARKVSERGGGLPKVQAMALFHNETIEIACNILDTDVTPPHAVQSFVASAFRELGSPGARVGPGYLPGLTPEKALELYDEE